MRRSAHPFLVFFAICVGPGLPSCNLDNPGDPPPRGKLYMPAGLILSPAEPDEAPRFLFVVNSNFDLRYNAGSLQAYDLDALDDAISKCGARLGPQCEIDPEDMLADEVLVPSLASYIASSSDRRRLYVATRTEANLAFVDVADDDEPLSCGDKGSRECSDAYLRYADPLAPKRRLTMPRDAVGIVAGPAGDLLDQAGPELSGEFVLTAHRGGEVSLFLDDTSRTDLELQDVLESGVREPTGIAFDPTTRLAYVSISGRRLISYSSDKLLGRVGVAPGADGNPAFLFDAGPVVVEGVSRGLDLQGLAVNPATPGQALVVSRIPESLLWVDLQSTLDAERESGPAQAVVWRTATVGREATRVITGQLGERTIAVVSCFGGRQIFILDAATAEPISIVHNFSGPYELALDSVRRRLYVSDFKSSVVRVLDLSALVDGASEGTPTARIIATLGHPEQVQELQ